MKNKKVNKFNGKMIITIMLLLIVVIGGTFAWFTYRSKETALVLSIGDINDSKVIINPYEIRETMIPANVYTSGVYSQVTAINNNSNEMGIKLFYRVNELDDILINNGLKYTIASSSSINGEYTEVSTGDFKTLLDDNEIVIFNSKVGSNTTIYYRVYLWLDSDDGEQSDVQNLIVDIELNGMINILANQPVLDDGMIPVVISNDGSVMTISKDDANWYDYEKQEWANIVLVNDTYRADYFEDDGVTIKENISVTSSHILAYYVWIPRYRYKIWTTGISSAGNEQTIDILFESKDDVYSNGSTVGSYRTHPAFWWDVNSDGNRTQNEMLPGIWVGKFETTGTGDNPTVLPNTQSLRNQNVSTQFQTSLKFAGGVMNSITGNVKFGGNGTYGLTFDTDSHMMKNSEWGAVAYLSHSQYGINNEVRINNYYNSGTLTGCGALTENEAQSTTCGIIYGDSTVYPQSTTGNITGVYDMSGGAHEFVMANYADMAGLSGFVTFPNNKYYGLYLSSQYTGDNALNMSLCTLETCGGLALSETVGWYQDYALFVSADSPWFIRGGYYSDGASAGMFKSSYSNGTGWIDGAFRSVLIPVDSVYVEFNDNLFSSFNQTSNNATISYDHSNSYLTINGTPSNGVDLMNLTGQNFIEGTRYKVTLTYIYGDFTVNDLYSFVSELERNGTSVSVRNHLDLLFPTSGKNIGYITINSAGASEADSLASWIWLNSSNAIVFNNYVVKVEITQVYDINQYYGSNYILPSDPVRPGYQFLGWYDSAVDSQNILMDADNTTDYNFRTILDNITPGVTYTLTMDSAILNSGTATQFTVLMHDFTSNVGLVSVVKSFSNDEIVIEIKCPDDANIYNDIRLLIYAGVVGSTSGNSVTYNNVRISTAGVTSFNKYTSSRIVSYNKPHVLYAVWKQSLSPVSSYSCANKSVGSEPYVLTYTGNCTVIDDGSNNWRIKFLTSGTFTSTADLMIDAFLVGGGGGGDQGGGGGGYTNTTFVNLKQNTSYNIVIGAGGVARTNGGDTIAFNAIANGGECGRNLTGGSGGSGGGGYKANGGSDGSNAYTTADAGGAGQARTTREFGESSGTLYSGGGGGAGEGAGTGGSGGGANGGNFVDGSSASANTGGGGGGGYEGEIPGSGGSGIVVIRNHRNSSTSNLPSVGFDFTYTGNYLIVNDGDGNWRIKFLTSGTFNSTSDLKIDAFLVGGGGGSNGIGGGGGGLTNTTFVNLKKNTNYNIVVGSGGSAGNKGGDTTAFNAIAIGGAGGSYDAGSGGSGGGGYKGRGGTDGNTGVVVNTASTPGSSQARTTREFGESIGQLYSGGGGGALESQGGTNVLCGTEGGGGGGGYAYGGSNGAINTGGGGGGSEESTTLGGSGIVVIRNHRNSFTSNLPSVGFNFTYSGNYLIVNDGDGNWRIKFLTSGTFNSDSNLSVDAFLVGGGGSGGAGGGGGGGYTITSRNVTLSANTNYDIVIGAGGIGTGSDDGNDGNNTIAFGSTANGGKGSVYWQGGDGGSAGGSNEGPGGMSDGESTSYALGQGTTTREFGETLGLLYAGGGGGAGYAGGEGGGGVGGVVSSGSTAVMNTGGGGGGAWDGTSGAGGSGIVVIRNKR